MNTIKVGREVKGFTLLELLIVITIIAILSVALIVVINPAETLKKSRDTQRLSDLAALKTAIAIYTTTVSSPLLDNTADASGTNDACFDSTRTSNAGGRIWYSFAGSAPTTAATSCPANTVPTTTDVGGASPGYAAGFCNHKTTVATATSAGPTVGWLPINFTAISGGSPISNLPLDPTNTIGGSETAWAGTVISNSNGLVYRYTCQDVTTTSGKPSTVYEINAVLESTAYTSTDNRMTKDGGDNSNFYEIGTSLRLLPGTGSTSETAF